MNRRQFAPLFATVLTTLLSSCAQILLLPTMARDGGWCREIGYDGVLRGDPHDPRIAWGEKRTRTNQRILRRELVWPAGYTASFTPELEILDGSRNVRFVAGDMIGGGCVTGPGFSGPLYVIEE